MPLALINPWIKNWLILNHRISSYIIMKCFGFFWMWMLISTFRCCTIQIPKNTRTKTTLTKNSSWKFLTYHHQLSKNPGGSPSDILLGSHFIFKSNFNLKFNKKKKTFTYIRTKSLSSFWCTNMVQIFINIEI